MMRLLDSDLRRCRDWLIALSAFALMALMFAFGLVPTTAQAAPTVPSCTGLDGAQGPLFFVPSSNSDTSLQPTPASGLTVAAGSTVYAVYHDETPLLDANGNTIPGPVHNLTFTYSGPLSGTVTPIFTTLAAGTGFGTMTPADDDTWVSPANRGSASAEEKAEAGWPHPDQEFDNVVKISGVIPNLTTSGDYLFHLQTNDGDNNAPNGVGDCGFADWRLHVKAQPQISTTPSDGGIIGTAISDSASVTGGQSPTGNVTFNLYPPSEPTCDGNAVFTDTKDLGLASGAYITAAVGAYHWRATYNGDENNATATSACDAEPVTMTKAQPGIGTTPSAGGPIGTAIHDTASVTGGYSPTGTVTFNLYAPGDATCASAIFTDNQNLGVVSGDYTTAAVGTYHWRATYNGDANNASVTSGCDAEPVTTTGSPVSNLHKQERDVTTSGSFSDGPLTASPGDTIQYQLVYTNTGNANATNVTVTDVVPTAHASYVAASCSGGSSCTYDGPSHTITWHLDTVQPGDAHAVTLNFSILLDAVFPAGSTQISNVGVVTTSEEESPTSSNPVITNVPAAPVSSIVKAQRDVTTGGGFVATTITASPGDVLEYRLTYSNTGNAPATNVVVSDPIPTHSAFLSCIGGCSHSATTVTWNLGTVAPGSVVLTFQVTLDSNFAAGTTTQITNAAVVTTEEEEGNSPSNTVVATVSAAEQVAAAAVSLPKAGQGSRQQGSSAPVGSESFGASGIVATLLLALIGSVLFVLRRRQSGAAEEQEA